MPATQLSEPSRRDTPDAAVRALLVEVASPVGNRLARLLHDIEPQPVRMAGLIWLKSAHRSAAAVAFADQLGKVVARPS